MNTINELCIALIKLNNTKKYKYIKRYELNKYISSLKYQIRNEDIFTISDDIITFLISSKINLSNVMVNNSCIKFTIDNDTINYSSKSQIITVTNDSVMYSISKNNRIPKIVKYNWDILNDKIHIFYIDIISKTVSKINK